MDKYHVTYFIGTKAARLFVVQVAADTEDDARYIAGITIPCIHGDNVEFTIIKVELA